MTRKFGNEILAERINRIGAPINGLIRWSGFLKHSLRIEIPTEKERVPAKRHTWDNASLTFDRSETHEILFSSLLLFVPPVLTSRVKRMVLKGELRISRVTTTPPSHLYFPICPHPPFNEQWHIWNLGRPSIKTGKRQGRANAMIFQVPEGMVGPAVLGYTAPPPMFPGAHNSSKLLSHLNHWPP